MKITERKYKPFRSLSFFSYTNFSRKLCKSTIFVISHYFLKQSKSKNKTILKLYLKRQRKMKKQCWVGAVQIFFLKIAILQLKRCRCFIRVSLYKLSCLICSMLGGWWISMMTNKYRSRKQITLISILSNKRYINIKE